MNEVKEDLRQLTLKRLRQAGVESAAHQLMNDLGRYYQQLSADPERLERETREDMEWQIGSFTLNDDEWI